MLMSAPRFCGGMLARLALFVICLTVSLGAIAPAAHAQVTAFRQAVAEAAARDEDLAAFYRARSFEGIWTGPSIADRNRRAALLAAFSQADMHGLPASRYDPATIMQQLRDVRSPADQGRMEVELSRLFLQYARDVQTGVLTPGSVVREIRREVPYRARLGLLEGFAQSSPSGFLQSLPPSSPEYGRLLREKLRLEALLLAAG